MPRTLNDTDRKILELAKAEDPDPIRGVNLHVHRLHFNGEDYEVRHTFGYHQYIHVWKDGQNTSGGQQVFDHEAWLDRITTTDVDKAIDALTAALRDIVGDEDILEVSAKNDYGCIRFEVENLTLDHTTGNITRGA